MNAEFTAFGEAAPAPEQAFFSLLTVIQQRFNDAVETQRDIPGYRHFLLDRQPGVPDGLATFILAEDYALARQGKAESFELSLPIEEPDILHPRLKQDGPAYFILSYTHQDEERRLLVDLPTFARLRYQVADPPLAGLFEKILTYQVIPVSKPKY